MTYSSLKVQIQKEKRKFHQGIRKEETNINNNNIDDKIIRSIFDFLRNKTCQEK
jgi:hypothetical protein